MKQIVQACFVVVIACCWCHLYAEAASRISLEFGPWSEWSACNGTICGGLGTQKRIRRCLTISCPDEVQETVCRYENEKCIGVADWSEWSEWSTCSLFCGDGTKERTRNCHVRYSIKEEIISNRITSAELVMECPGKAKEIIPCTLRYNCRVDGQWSEWSKWDICDAPSCSSEVGQQTRYRRCTNPRPMFGGKKCHGSSIGTKSCYNNEYCSDPVDGQWCNWMPWSGCENQVQKRSRQCSCPDPVNNGRDCDGGTEELQACD